MLAVVEELSILTRLRDGNEQAWADLFPRLWEVAFTAAALHGLLHEDIEDAACAAINQLPSCIQNLERFDDIYKLLASVSRKRAIDLIRKKLAEKRPQTISPEQIGFGGDAANLFDLIPSGTPSEISVPSTTQGKINSDELIPHLPDRLSEVELEEFRELLDEVLNQVKEPGRSIWRDHSWQGLSYEELGKKYQKTPTAIKTSFCRTSAKLFKIIFKSPEIVKRLKEFLR